MNIQGYVGGSLILIIFSLIFYTMYLSKSLTSYKDYAVTMQMEIDNLKAQSEAEKKRFAVAQKQALAQMEQVQQTVDQIQSEPVSHNCVQAVKWGLQEAKKF